MIVGVPTETFPGEGRVALTPNALTQLKKKGVEVLVQAGAGVAAGFADSAFEAKGGTIVQDRKAIFEKADVIAQVRSLGANPVEGEADLALMRKGQVIAGLSDPLGTPELAQRIAETGVIALGMELVPRITRAQSMDVLSSMATIAGYKAVLMAANELSRMFPMLMTAAGTVAPAHVLVIGAGVAGLQAIATARRLGGIVHAYDIRPATEEQVLSLGGKFVKLDLDTGDSEDKGGYAKAVGESVLEQQRKLLAEYVKKSDVVITTAAVPGGKSPKLISEDAVKSMAGGSVIVDLAAEKGGNCDLTKEGETVVVNGVKVIGPLNVPATIPFHASQMYGRNMATLLLHLIEDGELKLDFEDQITHDTVYAKDGEVTNERIRGILGLDPLEKPEEPAPDDAEDDDAEAEAAEGDDEADEKAPDEGDAKPEDESKED